ncbi:MAG: DNA methyltransferase [Bacteroidales bacterium]|nr:DNA methyltransferase [Bacteroidales bacterium]
MILGEEIRLQDNGESMEAHESSMVAAEPNLFGNPEFLTGAAAMRLLRFSRHTFEKCVGSGLIHQVFISNRPVYDKSDIDRFMETTEYQVLFNGIVDERNDLNDLTGKEWIPETKSYFFQKGLGKDHPDAQIERLHPAPFSFQDIEKLILFFTKKGMRILDPFGGVGSTAKACETTGRYCISIELQKKYHDLSIKRLEKEVGPGASKHHSFINGDTCAVLPNMLSNSVDFVVTSPPYWGILHKQDQKVLRERVANNLDTKYSDDLNDLGNIYDYNEFLDILSNKVFLECARLLHFGKYMAIIVSDFRDKGDFISFHSDLIYRLNKQRIVGGGILALQGTKILIQNHKSLHPYGYPFSYVENIHHQYVLIFKKK